MGTILTRCEEHGVRMTNQRRVIASVLEKADDHPDVEELYARASALDANISIATVYRTVKLFEDAGIIERHEFREGRARYEQIPESHHDHLINLRTGEVIEFQSEAIEKLQAEVARKLGITEQTYYRWRREYGGMTTAQAKKLKELEKENQRLKRAVADLTLDNLILKEAAKGNF